MASNGHTVHTRSNGETSTAKEDHTSTSPTISWPVNRPTERGDWNPRIDQALRARESSTIQHTTSTKPGTFTIHPDFYPHQKRSLSGVALRSFLLGLTFSASTLITLYCLVHTTTTLWRLPVFLATLSLFHFLEYLITAAYNTAEAKISSFLLTTNGSAYQIAHTAAALEGLLTPLLFPTFHARVTPWWLTVVGFALLILGQTTRTLAMAHAGTNFNHMVQARKKSDHQLVTSGIYAYLRHPSYFGFFWWGLGTQLVLGNVVCFAGYTVVLWKFFKDRITKEEKYLVAFFGEEYGRYRARTPVGIPFIR